MQAFICSESVFADAILCPREDLIRQWLSDEWSESLLGPGRGRRYSKVPRLPDQTCHIRNAWRLCCWETQQKDVQSVCLCEWVRNRPTQKWLARTWINVYIYERTSESTHLRTQTCVWIGRPERPARSFLATRLGSNVGLLIPEILSWITRPSWEHFNHCSLVPFFTPALLLTWVPQSKQH